MGLRRRSCGEVGSEGARERSGRRGEGAKLGRREGERGRSWEGVKGRGSEGERVLVFFSTVESR